MTDIYAEAIHKWGLGNQVWMLIEECGEVMQALGHENRGRCDKSRVLEELVDLQVVLNSVKLGYTTSADWNKRMQIGERRLAERLK